MAKRKKQKAQRPVAELPRRGPKLGWQDRLLYLGAIGLCIAAATGTGLLFWHLGCRLTFAPPEVIASGWDYRRTLLIFLPLWFCFVAMVIGAVPLQYRVPVFGRKDVSYGPPQYSGIYPLLWKNRPQLWMSRKDQVRKATARKKRIVFTIVSFLVCLLLSGLSVAGRVVLLRDGTVQVYNCLGQKTVCYGQEEVTAIHIDIEAGGGRYGRGLYSPKMTLRFSDGHSHAFSFGGFRGDDTAELRAMIFIRDLYGVPISIDDQEKLGRVIRDQNLDASATELLCELFQTTP